MPNNCAVYGCGHNSKHDKDRFSFYHFPAIIKHQGQEKMRLSNERRQAWINNISRDRKDLTSEKIEHTHVCSDHFISGIKTFIYMYWLLIVGYKLHLGSIFFYTGQPAKLYDNLNPDWAPTQKMGHDKLVVKVSSSNLMWHERAEEREKKRKHVQEADTLQRSAKLACGKENAAQEISNQQGTIHVLHEYLIQINTKYFLIILTLMKCFLYICTCMGKFIPYFSYFY